jgi:hypothetical protein
VSKWSLSLGAPAGLATGMTVAPLPHCRDGWASGSIGRPGACSWHGGVSHAGDFLALIAGVAAALLVMCAVHVVGKGLAFLGNHIRRQKVLLGNYIRRQEVQHRLGVMEQLLWAMIGVLAASLFALSALKGLGVIR